MKNCEKCKKPNKDKAKFCINCGNLLVSQSFLLETLSTGSLDMERLTDRYGILNRIKTGGMGKIFMGVDKNLSKVCAIKELLENQGATQQNRERFIDMFEREAKLLASLNHINLPRVYDYFILEDKYYLVMDYIDGDDLLTVMNEKYKDGCPEELVSEWSIQICDVLVYLHSRIPPIIYRDLKPDNIMLKREENTVFLIDFGIARAFMGDKELDAPNFATVGYASPEQCAGKECDARSDTYSLGTTMYHLLTGVRPQGFSDEAIKRLKPGISFYMVDVIEKARKIQVKERYQTAEEFKNDLLLWKDPFSLIQRDKTLTELDILILQLKSTDTKTRINAIKSLSKGRDRKITVSLIKMLYDNDVLIQQKAASVLGEIGDTIAIEGLISLLRSNNKDLYKVAIESLEKIKWPEDGEISFLCLKDIFGHKDKNVRLFAFSQQSKHKFKGFYHYLLKGLENPDINIRKISARTLGQLGNSGSLPPLQSALEKEGFLSLGTKLAIQRAIQEIRERKSLRDEEKRVYQETLQEQIPEMDLDSNDFKTEELLPLETKKLGEEDEDPSIALVQEYKFKVNMGMKKQDAETFFIINDQAMKKLKTRFLPGKLKPLETLLNIKFSKEKLNKELTNFNFIKNEIDTILNYAEVEKPVEPKKDLVSEYKSKMNIGFKTKSADKELSQLKLQLEKDRKVLEEKKRQEIEERRRKMEGPKERLERERKFLEEKKRQEMEERKMEAKIREEQQKEIIEKKEDFSGPVADKKVILAREKFRLKMDEEKKALKEEKQTEQKDRKSHLESDKGLNCWEFTKCGKEGVCPAYPKKGRKCAHTVGNIEGRKPRGPLASQKNCAECNFFKSEHYKGLEED